MRLIDADNLEDVVTKANEQEFGITRNEFKRIELVLSEFPTIDAEPIKHGYWKKVKNWFDECSVCHYHGSSAFRRCPNCGAKMDEVTE